MQRGHEFAIFAGPTPLMNSRMSSSEIVLAEIACERLKGRRKARMLIGGYGMGFTLRAALAGLDGDARVVVAELVPRGDRLGARADGGADGRLPGRSARDDP